jgi:hypothetical protein
MEEEIKTPQDAEFFFLSFLCVSASLRCKLLFHTFKSNLL